MNWTQRTVAGLVRVLARRLRERLGTNPRPVFRDRTVKKLQAALAEAAPALALTPAQAPVYALAEALQGITPTDLRGSRLLREQTVKALAIAERDLKAVTPSPFQETTDV